MPFFLETLQKYIFLCKNRLSFLFFKTLTHPIPRYMVKIQIFTVFYKQNVVFIFPYPLLPFAFCLFPFAYYLLPVAFSLLPIA